MQYVSIKTNDLIPYARNARTHSEQQVTQIASSIKEFGFINPVIIDAEDGIIAGHGRVLAAQKLKLKTVPCVRVEHLSETQKRAYILADNKLAMNAGWDEELLRVEIATLKEENFDALLTGFSEEEITALLESDVKPLANMPDLPEGDRAPIQQMTFTLHDDQVEAVKQALSVAKSMGDFVDTGNENSNGNALARACELFISWGRAHGIG